MDATVKVQARIRHNAEEVAAYMADLAKWEQSMNNRSRVRTTRAPPGGGGTEVRTTSTETTARPRSTAGPRQGAGTVTVSASSETSPPALVTPGLGASSSSSSAAAHTYDKGYRRWDSFNPDECEDDESPPIPGAGGTVIDTPSAPPPASIADIHAVRGSSSSSSSSAPTPVPRARGAASAVDAEAAERERGNDAFNAGNFAAAVKAYTKCLGMKVLSACMWTDT
jgi:hypothetical protein